LPGHRTYRACDEQDQQRHALPHDRHSYSACGRGRFAGKRLATNSFDHVAGAILEHIPTMEQQPPWDIRERAFQFSCDIVKFCRTFRKESGCQRIADQLQDAGTSVGANAEEAKAAYSKREFALKTATRSRKRVNRDIG
jgi:hypothetical protein